ncbi:hypothetical protein K2173_028315 [Erythroxylum novogranatense]|uniref:Uncharacterized protein n=1 Tax=Erythroxylum novogranatense TaxID=1862640 RepID=A0AAV8U488_9ROSI|nr:hypothetical protein K2173_028315 [Erythroxylum novogranatense]
MESGHRAEATTERKTHLATTADEGDHNRKLSSLSHSSSSSSGDPFEIVDDDADDDDNGTRKPNSGIATESPPAPVTEKAAADDETTSPGYRIPSHVFARSKSNAPMEWSTASNESLFSIHTGNMSFTREQLCWFQGDYAASSPIPMVDCSSNQPPSNQSPSNKPAEIVQPNVHDYDQSGVTESKAAETMREVIRENEDQNNQVNSPPKVCIQSASLNRGSDASGTSRQSFAFPILTENKSESLNLHAQKPSRVPSQPATPKVVQQEQSQPQPGAETPKQGNTPKANSNGIGRWFSCFPCCSYCC